jgi:UDPglucose 6-dehydrogenase
MLNSFLATKVSFCIQFKQLCDILNINYEELRELFILDPRINPAHTFVYDEQPY